MRTLFVSLLLSLPAAAQGSAYTYCQSNANSFGTAASIGYSGSLALADGTFALTVTGCPPTRESFGIFTYGHEQYNVPFGNGYLCVNPFHPGIYRMAPKPLAPVIVVHSQAESPNDFAALLPGSSWNFQFWYRDPTASGQVFNLSDALHVDFAP